MRTDARARSMRSALAAMIEARSGVQAFEPRPIRGEAEGDVTLLYVYDFIDPWGVTAADVAQALAEVSTPRVEVRINSPGGDVFDGIAIHNLLRSSDLDVAVRVDGVAASAASIIAMGSDVRLMAIGSQMMIHDPWTFAVGNAADMSALAEMLEGQALNLAGIYAARSGQGDAAEWRARMLGDGASDGTWYMAAEAVDVGLATGMVAGGESASAPAPTKDVSEGVAALVTAVSGLGEGAAVNAPDAARVRAARLAIRRQRALERI